MKKKSIILLLCMVCTIHAWSSPDTTAAARQPEGSQKKDNDKENVVYGVASFYSKSLEGTKTSTGETFRHQKMTAASNNFKLGTWVRVTNLRNDKTVIVRINDRMHKKMAKKGRVVDLSYSAAKKLAFISRGVVKVKVEAVPKGTEE
ncbi:rare lipoprotein A [Filimonas lacunae]|uniref:Probable endolytic peptidoglycan transglycosylase RlpA n=1 Tax=Filimonas lacunae TaxID=477680 RepID=A0A173MLH1_9BACT|nr:septal ring lytic transglycosylase RlpA family protein [Filimonas lacunae]BAV08464.1 rare lipoprotein A precursor [Filimonas lacunae]SIT33981.1 rare lipoprotein A [Filimonas lacunae]